MLKEEIEIPTLTPPSSNKDLLSLEYITPSSTHPHPSFSLLSSTTTSSSPSFKKPCIEKPQLNSSLLERIHSLLPQLELANQALSKTHPDSCMTTKDVEIEEIEEKIQELHSDSEHHLELHLKNPVSVSTAFQTQQQEGDQVKETEVQKHQDPQKEEVYVSMV
ncbi:hypothetical protein HMI55_005725 [Coelomomyces lativittatus]|nr:hypothetical protein HMI55_005725 [Coelomomyces lativittatus]